MNTPAPKCGLHFGSYLIRPFKAKANPYI
jgi:TRAP-type C4-dicarboxylate transport system permease small subunit